MTELTIESNLKSLAEKIKSSRQLIRSEEHTKMAYIVPFIALLGYDVNSPFEVVPEYTCDFGVKKGEKVDYCIMNGTKPHILVECKDCRNTLTSDNISQLFRYFSVNSAKLAILTNGIKYMLFTDSAEPNKMDTEPFYKFNMLSLSDKDFEMINMLSKENCNNLQITAYSKLSLFKDEVDRWIKDEKNCISKGFINYIRNTINTYDLSNDDISKVIANKLFQQYDENDSADYIPEVKQNIKKPKVSSKTASGICGIYTLEYEDLENEIAGSYLCFIGIYDAVYNYTSMYKILFALIDFIQDTLHFTAKEIIAKNSKNEFPAFFSSTSESKSIREYRGVAFKGALSAKAIIQIAKEQCVLFEIPYSSFRVGLIDKETKQNLDKLGIESSFYKSYLEQRGDS